MKIVLAAGWYFPDRVGGTEVYVAALAERLRRAGHELRVVAPDATVTAPRRYQHDQIEVFRYPIPKEPSRAEARGDRWARGAEHLHAWLAEERPALFHLHSFTTGLGLWELRAAQRAGARLFVTSHESTLGYLCQRGTLMQWGDTICDGICLPGKCAACVLQKRGLPRPLAHAGAALPFGPRAAIRNNQARQRELFALVECFCVLTEAARTRLLANGAPAGKLVLNRLGASLAAGAHPRSSASPITVGYLGRFEALKGVADLLWAVTSQPELPLRLELRGPDDGGGLREGLVRAAGHDPRVRFAAAVSSAEVPNVLQSYDLLCCPSRCLEGGPTVALEALAAGTPVIGSRAGGLAEILPDDGRLFPPGDRAALAALLERVARDPSLVEGWRATLPPVRTMDEVAHDLLALYE